MQTICSIISISIIIFKIFKRGLTYVKSEDYSPLLSRSMVSFAARRIKPIRSIIYTYEGEEQARGDINGHATNGN